MSFLNFKMYEACGVLSDPCNGNVFAGSKFLYETKAIYVGEFIRNVQTEICHGDGYTRVGMYEIVRSFLLVMN